MSPPHMGKTVILALAVLGVGCDITDPDTGVADELEGVWIGQIIIRADPGLDGAPIRMGLTTLGTDVTGTFHLGEASGPVTGSFTFPKVHLVLTYEALNARCTMDGTFTGPEMESKLFFPEDFAGGTRPRQQRQPDFRMKRGLLTAAIAGGLLVAPACGNALGTASRDDNRRRRSRSGVGQDLRKWRLPEHGPGRSPQR